MNFIVGEYYRMRGQPAAALDVVRCMKIANRDGTNFDTCDPGEWEHVRIVPVSEPILSPTIRSCQTCEHCGMDMDMDPYCAHPAVLVQHSHGLVTRHALPLFCGGKEHNLWTPRKPR